MNAFLGREVKTCLLIFLSLCWCLARRSLA